MLAPSFSRPRLYELLVMSARSLATQRHNCDLLACSIQVIQQYIKVKVRRFIQRLKWQACHPQGTETRIIQFDLHTTLRLPLAFVCIHQMALPRTVVTKSSCSLLWFIHPERMKGWVGLAGWPIADGLPTFPHKWSSISCRSSIGQRKLSGHRQHSTAAPRNQPTIWHHTSRSSKMTFHKT